MQGSNAPRSPGLGVGLGLLAGLILLDIALFAVIFTQSISFVSFVLGVIIALSIPVIMLIAAVTAGLSRAGYSLFEDELVIDWGRLQQKINYHQIQECLPGIDRERATKFLGFRWPGCWFGRGQLFVKPERAITAYFFATRGPDQQLFIITENYAVGISPPDPTSFKENLDRRISDQTNRPSEELTVDLGFLDWGIWHDRIAQLSLGVAVLLNVVQFGYLTLLIGQSSQPVTLHFNSSSEADRFGPAEFLLLIPLLGLLTWVFAAIMSWFFYDRRNEHPVAYILCGSTVVIEFTTWLAILLLVQYL